MDYENITLDYYSEWLGCDIRTVRGARLVYSRLRDETQYGYSKPFRLFAWLDGERAIISYGDGAADIARALEKTMKYPIAPDELARLIEAASGKRPDRAYKFMYERALSAPNAARALAADEFPAYETFFKECHPGAKTEGWLREYFDEMLVVGACAGVFEGGALVSCTDLPSMPFMADKAREIGITTLPRARNRGFARAACLKAAEILVARGYCPQWSTARDNIASYKLALSIGFKPLAEILTL